MRDTILERGIGPVDASRGGDRTDAGEQRTQTVIDDELVRGRTARRDRDRRLVDERVRAANRSKKTLSSPLYVARYTGVLATMIVASTHAARARRRLRSRDDGRAVRRPAVRRGR